MLACMQTNLRYPHKRAYVSVRVCGGRGGAGIADWMNVKVGEKAAEWQFLPRGDDGKKKQQLASSRAVANVTFVVVRIFCHLPALSVAHCVVQRGPQSSVVSEIRNTRCLLVSYCTVLAGTDGNN